MSDSLLIALSALSTQQRAMEVTTHNIANAATPGYTRQRTELTAMPADLAARPGPAGRGVLLQTIRRVADQVVNDRVRQAQAESGRLDVLKQQLAAVEQALGEPGEGGLNATLGRLFTQFDELSSDPGSAGVRSAAISQLQGVTATFSEVGRRLEALLADARAGFATAVDQVNELTTQLAGLNSQIRTQMVTGGQPNDLIDQRDMLLGRLSRLLQVDARINAVDGTVQVSAGGFPLVGTDSALAVQISGADDPDTPIQLLSPNRFAVAVNGGELAAIDDLQRTLIPGLIAAVNELASTVAKEINARHATSTSASSRIGEWTSAVTFAASDISLDLDDPALAKTTAAVTGIPAPFAPTFTDASGNPVSQSMALNLLDHTTGIARKHLIRYDPGSGPTPASRSVADLVAAINTGRGGGFTVEPAGAIFGVTARLVSVSDGFQLQLKADPGLGIDFSPALDLRPTATAWTGPALTVAGADTTLPPLYPDSRLAIRVNGNSVEAVVRDPQDGTETVLGAMAIPLAGVVAFTPIPGITVSVPAGIYRSGDRFAVALDAAGAVITSGSILANTHVEPSTWPAGDATMTITGRYTGGHPFDPAQPWSMQVVTPGFVGARSTTPSPGNPPVVQFTFMSGPPGAPIRQTVQKTLDAALPAGAPVEIADGVYAVFSAGVLSKAGASAEFIVDGRGDSAGLLPALGINSLFTGSTAKDLAVDGKIVADPSRLANGRTRSAGDGSTLVEIAALRDARIGAGGLTLGEGWQTTATAIGIRRQTAERQGDIQASLQKSVESQRESFSGVNIDDEVGLLIQQQQAYSAAARVVTFARENIQTLLDLVR